MTYIKVDPHDLPFGLYSLPPAPGGPISSENEDSFKVLDFETWHVRMNKNAVFNSIALIYYVLTCLP